MCSMLLIVGCRFGCRRGRETAFCGATTLAVPGTKTTGTGATPTVGVVIFAATTTIRIYLANGTLRN
jgi:hypothetical protein